MTVTPTSLTRAAGISAAVAGLLFIAVQINHPAMDVSSVTTTEWVVRQTAKTVMAGSLVLGPGGMSGHVMDGRNRRGDPASPCDVTQMVIRPPG